MKASAACLLAVLACVAAQTSFATLIIPPGCASGQVDIPVGQRCGGDRDGCCQKHNIGSFQDGYDNCKNPNPYKEPAYCGTSIPNAIAATGRWTPWNCNAFSCEGDAICACNTGDCTCQSKQNFDNIKRNGNGYSKLACGLTAFDNFVFGGDYACQNPAPKNGRKML